MGILRDSLLEDGRIIDFNMDKYGNDPKRIVMCLTRLYISFTGVRIQPG